MEKMTGLTLFSGGGGIEVGLDHLVDFVGGVELDPRIAAHATSAGHKVTVADVRYLTFCRWKVDYLHVSPPCTRASIANMGGGETSLDLELGAAVIRAIDQTDCRFFSLENVPPYGKFEAFRTIVYALKVRGFNVVSKVVDAADYGTPQHRKRLLLLASKEGQPAFPAPTNGPSATVPWVGWLEAIEDLLEQCPASKLAPWQSARLQAKYGDAWPSAFLTRVNGECGSVAVEREDPAPTLTADGASKLRAMMVGGGSTGKESIPSAMDCDPAYTIKATRKEPHRVLIEGQSKGKRPPTVTPEDRPSPTQAGTGGGNVNRVLTDGEVVSLTPRCLARLQGFPDTYPLPTLRSLATKIIGNSVPPPLARVVIGEGLLGSLAEREAVITQGALDL